MTWGIESHVIDRFVHAELGAERISFARASFTVLHGGTPEEFMQLFRNWYGPTMNAFVAAEKLERAAEFQRALEALFARENRSSTPGVTIIPGTYLLVAVAR